MTNKPTWCDKAVGKIVMVREDDEEFIAVDLFVAFEPNHPQPFKCEMARHRDARPMTQEEFKALIYVEKEHE